MEQRALLLLCIRWSNAHCCCSVFDGATRTAAAALHSMEQRALLLICTRRRKTHL
jgi:hypothetical protein